MQTFYPATYYGAAARKFEPLVEAMVQLVGARHARFLSRGLAPGARVLDLGCGRGVVLGALADRGFEVHGLDVSEAAVEGADPRAHLRIAAGLAAAGYPDAFFDQVIIWHVLEHLADPRETVEEVHRVLRPGGRVVVAVPNFSSLQARWAGPAWFHLDPPRHLFHFPAAALVRLLESCGFTCGPVHHFSLRQDPFGWLQSALNKLPNLPRNGLYVLLQPAGRRAAGYDRKTRVRLRVAAALGIPAALALSVFGALARSGATVHLAASRGAGTLAD